MLHTAAVNLEHWNYAADPAVVFWVLNKEDISVKFTSTTGFIYFQGQDVTGRRSRGENQDCCLSGVGNSKHRWRWLAASGGGETYFSQINHQTIITQSSVFIIVQFFSDHQQYQDCWSSSGASHNNWIIIFDLLSTTCSLQSPAPPAPPPAVLFQWVVKNNWKHNCYAPN